jgi:hypothetical protein
MLSAKQGWLTAIVASSGPRYADLDGACFRIDWANSRPRWTFGFVPGAAEVEVHEEQDEDDPAPIRVRGESTGSDLIPPPWGLLMSFADVENHFWDAIPESVTRTPDADGGEQLRFHTPRTVVRLEVDQSGLVVSKKVTVLDSGEIDRLELRDVRRGS